MSAKKKNRKRAGSTAASGATVDSIRSRIDKRRSQSALQLAKKLAKEQPGPETSALLLEAYQSRIRDLVDSGSHEDARQLMRLVEDRYGAQAGFVAPESDRLAVQSGMVAPLLHEWRREDLPEPRRREISLLFLRGLTNPAVLATANELAESAPLRRGARAICRAMEEISGGALSTEARDALQVIGRRSPLAPWRLFVLALDAFHRRDDEASREFAARISPESAVARLVPVLERLRSGDPVAASDPRPLRRLIDRVSGGTAGLGEAVDRLGALLRSRKHREAVTVLREICPPLSGLHPRLGLRLIRWLCSETHLFDHEEMKSALAGIIPAREQVRLAAIETDPTDVARAFLSWSDWLLLRGKHDWSDDAAWLLFLDTFSLISAELDRILAPFDSQDLIARLERRLASRLPGVDDDDDDLLVPAGVVRLKVAETIRQRCGCAVRPHRLGEDLLRLAIAKEPTADRFRSLLHVVAKRQEEDVLAEWSRTLSDDVDPLLLLAMRFSRRNALKKALGVLEQARRIAPLNQAVRSEHFRVLVATLLRHGRAENWRLFGRDIEQIETLPLASRHEHRLFLIGCRAHLAQARGDTGAVASERQKLDESLRSPLVAEALLDILRRVLTRGKARRPAALAPMDRATELRVRSLLWRICTAVGISAASALPPLSAKREFLPEQMPGNDDALLALCAHAEDSGAWSLLHLSSGAGLRGGGKSLSRFAMYRWRSLRSESFRECRDERECRELATWLARRSNDTATLRDMEDRRRWTSFARRIDSHEVKLSKREIERRLAKERFLLCCRSDRETLKESRAYWELMNTYGGEKIEVGRKRRRRKRPAPPRRTATNLRQTALFELDSESGEDG